MPLPKAALLVLLAAGGLSIAAVGTQPPAEKTAAEAKPTTQPATQPPETPKAEAPKTDDLKPVRHEERDGGLIIDDLVIGTGIEIKEGAFLVFHYRGTLKADGKEFQSSYGGDPALYSMNDLITGWKEGIPGMKVGGKRRLTIPYQKAYGDEGRPPTIPGKADLIFEIEIVDTVGIEEIKIGDGDAIMPRTLTTIKYTGKVVGSDKNTFESGEQPIETQYERLLPGMRIGMDGMKVGGKRKLTFPAILGWQQSPPPFGEKAKFEFEIELLGVKAPAPRPPGSR